MSYATPQTMGHCPKCNAMRTAHVRARHGVAWTDSGCGISGDDVYQVLECAGCGTPYFQIEEYDRDMGEREWDPEVGQNVLKPRLTHYPAETRRAEPEWLVDVMAVDRNLGLLLRELYAALNSDLRVLAAVGARTVFDRASELLGVDSALPFHQKLNDLVTKGKIGLDEKAHLNVLIDAGSAAAHRGWRPKSEDIDTMMGVVEAFLKRAFVLDASLANIKSRVPPKPRRP
jgi:hypothetical protein